LAAMSDSFGRRESDQLHHARGCRTAKKSLGQQRLADVVARDTRRRDGGKL